MVGLIDNLSFGFCSFTSLDRFNVHISQENLNQIAINLFLKKTVWNSKVMGVFVYQTGWFLLTGAAGLLSLATLVCSEQPQAHIRFYYKANVTSESLEAAVKQTNPGAK